MTTRRGRALRRRARPGASVLVLWALAACPRPEARVPHLGSVEASDLLMRVQAAGAQRHQAVGKLRLDYLGADGLFRGEADVAVARPRHLRIELRSFFNQPAGALVCDGERFAYVDSHSGRTARGGLDDPALRELLPLSLDLDSTVACLLGTLPPLERGRTRYTAPAREHHLALRHDEADGAWLLELDGEASRLLELRHVDLRGEDLLRLRFADHDGRPGLRFPRRGEAQVRGREGALRWTWQEVELDGTELPAEAWQLLEAAATPVDAIDVE